MRILIVTGIFPPDIGGPATYVPKVATVLRGFRHDVAVVTWSDQAVHDDNQYSFPIMRLPRKQFKLLRELRTVTTIIRLGLHSDLIFVNGLALEAVLANLLLRKPMIQKVVGDLAWERATNKGWIKDSFESFQKKRYGFKVAGLKKLRAWWIRRADKVIAPSQYLASCVANWGVPKEKIDVIYNAFEPVGSIQPTDVPLQTPIKVVTVGRLVSWKRIDKVVEAISQIDGVGLTIIGDGPERGHLEESVTSLGMGQRVYFAGQRSKEETIALTAACDIFVLNSTYEGFPHVVLEAMALGLPVIATAVGGTPELVRDGENGVLIAPFDNNGLREALSRLTIDLSERKRFAEGACKTVEKFGFERMIEKTRQLLEIVACETKK